MTLLVVLGGQAGGDHQVTPVGLANSNAFGTAGLNGTLATAGHANGQVFGTVALNGRLAVAGFANTQAVGAPAVQARLGAVGLASSTAFGAVALNGSLAVAGAANGQAFGTASLNGQLEPAGFAGEQQFGQPQVGEEHEEPQPQPGADAPPVGGILAPAYTAVRSWRTLPSHSIGAAGVASAAVVGRPTLRNLRSMVRRRREEADLMRLAA